jgi:opacity protein-like surface antigen
VIKIKKEVAVGGLTAAVAAVAGAQAATADMPPGGEYVHDWSGFYIGAAAGVIFGGEYPTDELTNDYDAESDFIFGGFAGVNHQFHDSNLVAGVELAIQSGFDSHGGDPAYGDYEVTFLADAKARLGLALDEFLPYIFGGFSAGVSDDHGYYNYDYGLWGFNYGIGVDWMLTDNISLGAEVMGRTLQGYNQDDDNADFKSHWQGMLRAAFHLN